MSRGNRGADVFVDQTDRLLFLDTLDEVCGRMAWEIHAFVLMSNHYHFVLVTPRGNLVEGMKWFQGAFTQRINARHRWRGHLFQGRYRALYGVSPCKLTLTRRSGAGRIGVDGSKTAHRIR